MGPPSLYFVTTLAFYAPMKGFPWDDLCKILHGGQRMAKVHSGGKILPEVLMHCTLLRGCTNVTDRRQTDGFAIEKTRT